MTINVGCHEIGPNTEWLDDLPLCHNFILSKGILFIYSQGELRNLKANINPELESKKTKLKYKCPPMSSINLKICLLVFAVYYCSTLKYKLIKWNWK